MSICVRVNEDLQDEWKPYTMSGHQMGHEWSHADIVNTYLTSL